MNRAYLETTMWVTCLPIALLAAGCQRQDATVREELQVNQRDKVAMVNGSEPTEQQRAELLAAKDALFQRLSGRLMSAMVQGPAEAIAVCQKEAPEIATTVGEEQGVKIGRVGVRLRNPKNTGPEWAAPLFKVKQDTPVFANLSNGNAALLFPIRMQSQCLMCHGPKAQIAPIIQEQIANLYTDDEATGFDEGELRGWFWVEKPSR